MSQSHPTEEGRFRRAKNKLREAVRECGNIHAADLGGSNMEDVQRIRNDMLEMAHSMERWEEQAAKDGESDE